VPSCTSPLLHAERVALQNRVTPYGTLVAVPARGTLFGNRGCLHDDAGRIVRWAAGARWIACELSFKGRRRSPLVQPGRYTGLFFLDEATALAAGHRPCVECRRADFVRFADAFGGRRASEVDAALAAERPTRAGPRRWPAAFADLPDATMVEVDGSPHLVLRGAVRPWSPEGYGAPVPTEGNTVLSVVTPPSIVRALSGGYAPRLHPSVAP
jgi:hypothetical protein